MDGDLPTWSYGGADGLLFVLQNLTTTPGEPPCNRTYVFLNTGLHEYFKVPRATPICSRPQPTSNCIAAGGWGEGLLCANDSSGLWDMSPTTEVGGPPLNVTSLLCSFRLKWVRMEGPLGLTFEASLGDSPCNIQFG